MTAEAVRLVTLWICATAGVATLLALVLLSIRVRR